MPRKNNSIEVKPRSVEVKPRSVEVKPQHTITSQSPTLMDSMKHGLGFGIGSSVARNLFEHKPTYTPTQCTDSDRKIQVFKQCMETKYNDYDACATHLE